MSVVSVTTDPDFPALKERLIAATGLAYYSDRDEELAARVGRSMARLGLVDCASYLKVLEDKQLGGPELDALIAELTIGETYFFRQTGQFDALAKKVIPDILARNRSCRRFRIWSAGCATGAEPYSVALLLWREFGHEMLDWEVNILATDINREFLARAREARFDEWALRATPGEVKRAFFQQEGKTWVLSPDCRSKVTFQYHNLVRDPFPSLVHNLCAFDLILCRNVLIYFSREVARRVISQFHPCLNDGGWLLVGHAEPNAGLFHSFRVIMVSGETLYQKVAPAGETASLPAALLPAGFPGPLDAPLPLGPGPDERPLLGTPDELPVQTAAARLEAPGNALANVRLLADRGEWENAESCCRMLLAEEGLNPAAHFYYALVLEQMGRIAEAERSLRRALYLDRNFALAHYHLGFLLQRQDVQRAKRSFENAEKLLRQMDAAHVIADCDGITAAELAGLARTHLELLAPAPPGKRPWPQEGGQ